ncbi:Cytosolic non-specific dipeptidase [Pteropus alecto]|uniref:Cytosolic non-specific dipeptidase n=1 Tax=Pteropus alecto TaxID=9402 RepID=L5JQH2_PTEAL|nr:Cytosolic non-specific dipeptidase [Pteropus alecto]
MTPEAVSEQITSYLRSLLSCAAPSSRCTWAMEATGKNVMLLPMGSAEDGAHSQNEKLNRHNYVEGTKILPVYLYEVAQLKN